MPEAAAGLGDDVLVHVGKLLHDGGPEGVESVVGVLVGLGLDHAPEEVVEGVAVRGARGPQVRAPVVREVLVQPRLGLPRLVGGSRVLLEHIGPPIRHQVHPGLHDVLHDVDVDGRVDPEALLKEVGGA